MFVSERFRSKEVNMRNVWTEAREFYKNTFYVGNSKAHDMQHIKEVHSNMRDLIKSENLESQTDEHIVMLCAYLHDIFCESHRSQHHIKAKEYVDANSDVYLQRLSQDERDVLGLAVLEHRSSCNMKPSNVYSRLLQIADKGPADADRIFQRCRDYNRQVGDSEEDTEKRICHILERKYGENGYFYKDEEYCRMYAKEVAALKQRVKEHLKKYKH